MILPFFFLRFDTEQHMADKDDMRKPARRFPVFYQDHFLAYASGIYSCFTDSRWLRLDPQAFKRFFRKPPRSFHAMDGDKEIDFWLQLPHSRDARIEKLELSDLPERKPKTTRLRISAKPVSDSKVKIKIRDLGFGEIVKSSDLTWEYTMSL